MLVVAKFGGSSLANAVQFNKVREIVFSDSLRKVIVVSAIGRENKADNKITDLLYLLSAHIRYGVNGDHLWDEIYSRYAKVRNELALSFDLEGEIANIKKRVTDFYDENYLVSRGEYLSAKLMSEFLGYEFIDAEKLFVFDYHGKIDVIKTNENINYYIKPHHKIVVPGFYGVNPDGSIKLFSRGGSDVTGSILAAGLKAKKYENWTDVDGILITDPKIIDTPKQIKELNYDELRELSYMGASVIHEDTLFPIIEDKIPIHILNTNNPAGCGTIICNDANDNEQIITGITGKKNYISITITKDKQADKLAIICDVLHILQKFHINVEHLPTSIDSFSIVFENIQNTKIFEVISEIKNLSSVIDVKIDNDMALVAIVGRNMVTKAGISGKIFGILGEAGINIKMIAQGALELTIIIGISNSHFTQTIKELYMNLVK